jgi:alkylation response protein AidB-like acyl-CoA dehydrogenase
LPESDPLMRFAPDADQLALRDGLRSFLDKRCDAAAVRAAWAPEADGMLRSLWGDLAGMGVIGLLVPESDGGAGLDWETAALVLEEAGRAALPLPLIETMAVALPALVAAGDPAGVVAAVAAGELVVALSFAGGPVFAGGLAPGATLADAALVIDDSVTWYGPGEFEVTPERSVDGSRRLGRITPRGSGVPLDGVNPEDLFDLGALAAAAELVGLGAHMLEMTVAYVKGRQQHGVAIGSFQAVKHHLADVLMALEFARPPLAYAAYATARNLPDARRAVSMAKAMAGEAATFAARQCLQCHGAMGYTDEYDLQLWMKRAWALAATYGGAAWHRHRVGTEIGL